TTSGGCRAGSRRSCRQWPTAPIRRRWETEEDIVNCESNPGKLGSLSVSSYSPYSMRTIHYVPLGPPRKQLKVYFFLPHARPVPVQRWSSTSWFGQWSPDPPGLCDQRSSSPRPSARPVLAVEPERREKEEVGEGRPPPWG